jgi:hypothetical protein
MIIRASRILSGWNSPTKFFMPDQMELRDDRIIVLQREWMGLKREEEIISIERIASTRLQFGLIKATVILETFGGFKDDIRINGVGKGKARAFREEIQAASEARESQSPAAQAAMQEQS